MLLISSPLRSYSVVVIFLTICFSGCKFREEHLFKLLPPDETGIYFNNYIEETDSFNILLDEYIYNGGGVGVADFNNDGLPDLYFTGNRVSNRLYLNKGDLFFEDITEGSGVGAEDIWSSGISVVDINNDGWMDFYVSATFNHEDGTRKNKLFINQGLNQGIPVFVDMASDYGIDDDSHTTQSVFFDYDLDGDLDLYLLTNVFLGKRVMTDDRVMKMDKSHTADILYRNNGDGTFTDVSEESGISYTGFGLGIAVLDINLDNYPDLYVSNDFVSSDVLYVNNRDGTFSNQLASHFKHISYASMGSDAADMNNDGWVDILTLEMLPSDVRDMKMMYTGTVFNRDQLIESVGHYKQYLRNCLQYNNGDGTFSDISYLLGIGDTDWSWSALFADFDNDGFKDLAIANGFPRDVTDKDYMDHLMEMVGFTSNPDLILPYIPEYKSHNFIFRNHNGQKFEDMSEIWGFAIDSYSNGAVFSDLDNDGDLDYITNNINHEAFVLENITSDKFPERNWLKINLKGNNYNLNAIGTKIYVYAGEEMQFYEHNLSRGYISSVDPVIHFGLGTRQQADSVHVIWSGGQSQIIYKLKSNETHLIEYNDAKFVSTGYGEPEPPLFREITDSLGISYKHEEVNFFDYRIQSLLPHMHSRSGPGMAVGDLNGDDLEDLVIGNGGNQDIFILMQNTDGGYEGIHLKDTAEMEVTGLLLFDPDDDNDLDLYVVSGGSEYKARTNHYRDRFFRNNGRGEFTYDPEALPDIYISGSVVTAADYDRDGDLDLFVGGRVVPQSYPLPERSILLQNVDGRFRDVTKEACADFMSLGMVTTALWTDFDQDGWTDLMVAGEWMPVRMFRNEKGKFKEVSKEIGLGGTEGWWNSINSGDFDADGDLDYILGNQGQNNRYGPLPGKPIYVIAKDFDNNGIIDPVINAWYEDNYYPVHLRNDIIQQISFLKSRFTRYSDYNSVKSPDLFSEEELEGSVKLLTKTFSSAILVNLGNGKYEIKDLPFKAQFAPVNGILVSDLDLDGNSEILLTGNNYTSEAITGAHDAFYGLILGRNNNGAWRSIEQPQSGFIVEGDGRSLVTLVDRNDKELIFAAQNNDSLKIFTRNTEYSEFERFHAKKNDRLVKIFKKDGTVRVRELYYGQGYLSQSSRDFLYDPRDTERIIVTDFQNNSREIKVK